MDGDLLRIGRIAHGALLGSLVFYVIVLHVVPSRPVEPLWPSLRLLFLALAVVQTALAWVARPRPGVATPAVVFTRWAICFSLAEAIGIYGFAVGFMTADVGFALPLIAWAAVLLLALRPRTDQIAAAA
jgi:hypothetical protein